MPSTTHIIGHGFLNFGNQVLLLLYKNFTRLIRRPWVLIFFVFFPSIMLGILFGLQTTLMNRFGQPDAFPNEPKPPSKCTNPVYAKDTKCITLGWTDDEGASLQNRTRNWSVIRLVSKQLGWSMSPTFGDNSTDFDVVYFGLSMANLEKFNYYGNTTVKYILTHDRNVGRSYSDSSMSPENYYGQYGGPDNFDLNSFGFGDELPNPETNSLAGFGEMLQDAYIAVRQAESNGWTLDQALLPNVRINVKTADPPETPETPETDHSDFTGQVWMIGGPIIIWISLFGSQLYLSSQILEDRRKKLRLGMVMMGLNTGAYQVSWFIFHIALSLVYSLLALGIGHACKFHFFTRANPAVIFLLYWLTSWGAIGFTLFTTSIVHHPTGHTALMVVAFLIGLVLAAFSSNFPSLFFSFSGARALWSVNYNFQFGNIAYTIASVTLSGTNSTPHYFRWKDIHLHLSTPRPPPTVADSFGFLILCGLLGLIVSIFLEIVFPREIGAPRPFFFFFFPSYWGFDTKSRLKVETIVHRANKMSDVAADLDPDVMAEYNDVMSRLNAHDPTLALAITKLSKSFKKGRIASDQDTRAVDCITLGADEGSVLGIVGHNGAGKTTLMSMLCGVVPTSTGDACVFGHSVSQNMTSIHQIMGVCPQEDVLWPELTPYEHLKLFAILKRIPWSEHEQVITDGLNEVGLLHVRDRIANKLSGGMKRRLSVAIALIGKIKIIILDEPTAGLDPRNRLEIWSIIERIKKDRVVILTTHSMSEASSLADKIAVMAVGRLRGVGSPQHLVQRFGKGHQISIISKVSKNQETRELMAELLPDAQLEIDTGARLTYSLAASKSRQLPDFCKYMETENNISGLIEDWGVSQTTLEQVFLRLTHGGGNQEGLTHATALQLNVAIEGSDDIIGFVPILPETTLAELRETMLTIEDMPEHYQFIFNRAPVSLAQERTTTAYRALPIVELRLKDPEASLSSKYHKEKAPRRKVAKRQRLEDLDDYDTENSEELAEPSDSVPVLKAHISRLEAQLQTKTHKMANLKAKIRELEAQLKSIRRPESSEISLDE